VGSERGPAIGELIEAAAARLRAAGIVKPRREAHRLWAWQHRNPAGQGYLDRELPADPDREAAFADAVRRRVEGEPIAYVLGSIGFRHLDLLSDRRALIPRPESELLVELALSRVRIGKALDVCTGSGCLALSLAQEGEFSSVTATDLSADALSLAAENGRRSGLAVHWVRCDLAGGFRRGAFDLLVSNPPYLTEAEYAALPAAVRQWEPKLALASGDDGLGASARLLLTGRPLLRPGGWLVMELDSSRGAAVAACARDSGWEDVLVMDDLFGRARYLTARRGQGE